MSISIHSVALTSDNPRWVGAWWIGFLISGALAFIVALPLGGFPKKLPGQEKYKKEREQEVYNNKKVKATKLEEASVKETALNFKQILKSVKVLLLNPTFMFLNLAAACEGKTSFLLFSLISDYHRNLVTFAIPRASSMLWHIM